MKNLKKFISCALAAAILTINAVPVSAAQFQDGAESPNYSIVVEKSISADCSSTTIGLVLNELENGTSNVGSFNFSGIPEDAVVTKIVIEMESYSTAGKGSMLVTNLHVVSPTGDEYIIEGGLRSYPPREINNISQIDPRGKWKLFFNGENHSDLGFASILYKNCKMTLYYNQTVTG